MNQDQLTPELFLWILTSPMFRDDNFDQLAKLCDYNYNKTSKIAKLLWECDITTMSAASYEFYDESSYLDWRHTKCEYMTNDGNDIIMNFDFRRLLEVGVMEDKE